MPGAPSPHIAVRPEWLAMRQEDILLPEQAIVDPHHHLWDRPSGRYLLPELMADVSTGHDVRATVYVQCRSMYCSGVDPLLQPVGEVEFANGIAAQAASGLYGPCRACAGIVGCADLTLGDRVEPVLDALQCAGNGRLRGIRNQTAWHTDARITSNPVPPRPGLLLDPEFREGARRLARFKLTLDIWAYHTQLSDVVDLVRACPDTDFVLDHLGGPVRIGPYRGKDEEVFSSWKQSMAILAALPNVVVKLGGLCMKVGGFDWHLDPRPPSSLDLAHAFRPYVMTAIELFGTGRAMFESNFPVDKGMVSYAVLWNAFKRLMVGHSDAERDDLFYRTAARVYRIADMDLQGAP